MSIFFRRGARDDGRLPVKIALFTVGALLAVVGMALRNDWVVTAAAVVLGAGILVRLLPADGPENGETNE